MKYTTPETKSLQVNAQFALCEGSPAPPPAAPERMSLPNVSKTQGSW